MSVIEVSLASAIVLVAFVALMQMITAGSTGARGNQLRSIAMSEAVYGVENVKAEEYDSIPTTPVNRYVTDSFSREGVDFTRVVHYKITDSNHDGFTNSADYIIASVTVQWAAPPPTKTVTMSIYKLP